MQIAAAMGSLIALLQQARNVTQLAGAPPPSVSMGQVLVSDRHGDGYRSYNF